MFNIKSEQKLLTISKMSEKLAHCIKSKKENSLQLAKRYMKVAPKLKVTTYYYKKQ